MEADLEVKVKRAPVQIVLDSLGSGSVVIAGVDISNIVAGFRLRSAVGDAPVLSLDLRADAVELDAPDIVVLLNMLRADPAPPLEHDWTGGEAVAPGTLVKCAVCRQVRNGREAAVCPGPLK